MFKEVQLTLYEIFGYFLPGVILLLAFDFLFWSIFWTSKSFTFPSTLSPIAITTLLFAAYLAGHLTQALGNLIEKLSPARKALNQTIQLPSELRGLLLQALAAQFGEQVRTLKASELFHLCDQMLIQKHSSREERDLFTYREGFYRGNFVALTLMACFLVIRLILAPVSVVAVSSNSLTIGRPPLALAAALVAISAWLSYERFIRFVQRRYTSCFIRFLVLAKSTARPPTL